MNTELPYWTNEVLQGLAYWIGYKQSLYNDYPIREGEMVGEALNLLSGKIDRTHKINAEVMYKDITPTWSNNERIDILISKRSIDFDYSKHTEVAIEVKRKEATAKDIEKDFQRLSKLKSLNKNIRCFLLYISPNSKPEIFTSLTGRASNKEVNIVGDYFSKCRTVKKSTDKFYTIVDNKRVANSIKKANYVCLIEVYKKG